MTKIKQLTAHLRLMHQRGQIITDSDDFATTLNQIDIASESQPPIDNKAVDEWINVEDRLPDVSEKYGESDYLLCIDEHNNQEFVGWYSNKYGWKVAHYMAISSEVKVTHWQPLPKKPKTLPSNHQQSNPPK